MTFTWSEKELEILKKMWRKFSIEEICEVLKSRTFIAVRHKANSIGLPTFEPEIDLEQYAKMMEVKEG